MRPQLSNCINFFDKLILNELRDICKVWIAGGAVRDYFSVGYLTSDIDLYFPNEIEYQKCYEYFLKPDEYGETRAKEIFSNENVIKIVYKKRKYDIIKRYFLTPTDTINAFDFTVCCVAVNRDEVFYHETFFIDLAKRALVINKLPFPLSTLWRMQKYIQKGFRICSGGLMEISKAISKLELHKEIPEEIISEIEFYPDGTPKFIGID